VIGSFLIEFMAEGVLELLWHGVSRPAKCPQCRGRLKYVSGAHNQRQCVMCERLWQQRESELTFIGYPRNPLSIK
jgi:hypothetical protein